MLTKWSRLISLASRALHIWPNLLLNIFLMHPMFLTFMSLLLCFLLPIGLSSPTIAAEIWPAFKMQLRSFGKSSLIFWVGFDGSFSSTSSMVLFLWLLLYSIVIKGLYIFLFYYVISSLKTGIIPYFCIPQKTSKILA